MVGIELTKLLGKMRTQSLILFLLIAVLSSLFSGCAQPSSGEIVISSVTSVPLSRVDSIACSSIEHCIIVGESETRISAIATTFDGGASWTKLILSAMGSSELSGISCITSTWCLAVGNSYNPVGNSSSGLAMLTMNGGLKWQKIEGFASTNEALNDVTCFPNYKCFVIGNNSLFSVDLSKVRRANLHLIQLPLNFTILNSNVACWNSNYCIALAKGTKIGFQQVMETSNGGHSWKLVFSPNLLQGLSEIQCEADASCSAFSSNQQKSHSLKIFLFNLISDTITSVKIPDNIAGVSFLTCKLPKYCLVGGLSNKKLSSLGEILVSTDKGISWSRFSVPYTFTFENGTSCLNGGCSIIGYSGSNYALISVSIS